MQRTADDDAANAGRMHASGRIAAYPLPGEECLSLNKVQWRLDPRAAALLIHDAQNFWIRRFEDAETLVGRIVRLRDTCRRAGMPVIYTRAERARTAAERGLALDLWGPGIGEVEGARDDDTEIVPALAPADSDYVIEKPKYSAFYDTPLERIFARTNRRQLVLCGVYAHHGCLLTAADGYMRNYQVFSVADAQGDYSRADHEMALGYVSEVCGQLSVVAEIERALDGRM